MQVDHWTSQVAVHGRQGYGKSCAYYYEETMYGGEFTMAVTTQMLVVALDKMSRPMRGADNDGLPTLREEGLMFLSKVVTFPC